MQAQEPIVTNIPPDAEYPFKRDIEKGKYDKADEKIRRRISRDSNNLECHYAAYKLYSTDGCPLRNLDTAYRHLVRVRRLYADADEKELERWSRDSYSGALIDYDLQRLGEQAIADAHRLRTPDAYQHLLSCYTLLPRYLQDSVTNSRDSLEFDIARRTGTIETLQAFINRRPNAAVMRDAVLLRDSLAFAIADSRHTYTAYQQFRVAYPNSHLYDRATDSVYVIDYRDVLQHNAEQYYRGYAERYPASPYADRCAWLADSIEYHREVDSTDWQSILYYLDSRNRPHWSDSAALCLTRFALRHNHVKAAQHAVLRTRPDAPLRSRLGLLLHDAYLYTSILNYSMFYNTFPNLVSDEQRRADSVGHLYYLAREQHSIDSCILHIAPYREAYQLLQQRIKDDLEHHRWKAAFTTANRFADAFGNDYDFHQLVATLDRRNAGDNKKMKNEVWRVESGIFQHGDTMLSADGHIRLFVADGDCHGQAVKKSPNIYVSLLDSTGVWSTPIELGPTVNTPYEEQSPFLLPDMHTLYFSSQGHGAIGGLDVFMSTRLDDSWTNWSTPVNLGRETNTTHDDWIEKIEN